MLANANTVNIAHPRRYHHGDLRQALVEEGLRALGASDADTLSLRAIARAVGVSATAVYRHFPDKTALLAALCCQGDELLAETLRGASAGAGGGRAGLEASGRAYVQFALDNPALFRLMMAQYRGVPGERDDSAGLRALLASIAELTPGTLPEEATQIRALQSWALVHGLAVLMLDGVIPPDEALIEKVIVSPAIGLRRTD